MCDVIIGSKLDLFWKASVRPDNLDKELLDKMKKAGCVYLQFGIESGSPAILKNMGKGFVPEKASRVLKESHSAGIINYINIDYSIVHK